MYFYTPLNREILWISTESCYEVIFLLPKKLFAVAFQTLVKSFAVLPAPYGVQVQINF